MNIARSQKGFTLVEVLIASAIILGAVLALLGVYSLYLRVALSNSEAVKAAYLAEESLEAVRFWRDVSWNNKIAPIAKDTAYGLSFAGGVWATTTDLTLGAFERSIMISPVYRDASSDIVSSGGTLDTDTVLVTSSVSWWKGGATTTKTVATYLTNLYGN
jgi:prepilin-type N-terminal cleavage/methylation domain-containing protein